MAKMTKLEKVQKAIEIQGYITVSVGDRGEMKARSIKVVDGDWVTDILTSDLRGHVRIRKTKADIVRQAEYILSHEAEILARRESENRASLDWVMRS